MELNEKPGSVELVMAGRRGRTETQNMLGFQLLLDFQAGPQEFEECGDEDSGLLMAASQRPPRQMLEDTQTHTLASTVDQRVLGFSVLCSTVLQRGCLLAPHSACRVCSGRVLMESLAGQWGDPLVS